jgi:hypothetical protein
MKELDLLKKNWHKAESSFQQVSEKQIYEMIHKKSSSIVKWILIISIIEFVVLNGIGLLLSDQKVNQFMSLHPYLNILDKANYLILIGFIYFFYKNYKSISTLDSSKKLITAILNTRKVVNIYILWNVFIGSFFGAYGVIDGFNSAYSTTKQTTEHTVVSIIVVFIVMLLIMGFIFLFYKLLYGTLLNKLLKNYKDLKEIEL